MKKLLLLIAIIATTSTTFYSCLEDSQVVSNNISVAAHQFEIYRRVVFYNGITDTYILQVEGYCTIENDGNKISVVVKTDNGEYLKHYLGLSDNVTYFAEQLEPKKVSNKRYKVIFKPSVIIPDVDIK